MKKTMLLAVVASGISLYADFVVDKSVMSNKYWEAHEVYPYALRFEEKYVDTEEFWEKCKDPKKRSEWRRPATDAVIDFLSSLISLPLRKRSMSSPIRLWSKPTGMSDVKLSKSRWKWSGRIQRWVD